MVSSSRLGCEGQTYRRECPESFGCEVERASVAGKEKIV